MQDNERVNDEDLDLSSAFDKAFDEMKKDIPDNWDAPEDDDSDGRPLAIDDEDKAKDDRAEQTEVGEKPAKTQADIAKESARRPWAGRFNTAEEMEQHLLRIERGEEQPRKWKDHRQEPEEKKDAIDDLTAEELVMLSEHDEADGTKNLEAYFRHKMQMREMSPFEAKALKDYDEANGTDLYGDYREARTERRLMQKFSPVLKPLAERNQAEERALFMNRESEIDSGTAAEFGDEFESLRKQSTDVELIEKVLKNSPVSQVIFDAQEKSPATAHRLLLREIQRYNAESEKRTKDEKRKKSVPADIGGGGRSKVSNSADSVEEAFDAAYAELR